MRVKNHKRDRRIFGHTASTFKRDSIPGKSRYIGGTRR